MFGSRVHSRKRRYRWDETFFIYWEVRFCLIGGEKYGLGRGDLCRVYH